MLDITVFEGASASPEQVLAIAMDFSEERVKVWSNSKPRYFQVHAQGADFAEVTEGFRPPFGRVWERSRYEWGPGSIRQTVIDSNVLAPGSTWEAQDFAKWWGAPKPPPTLVLVWKIPYGWPCEVDVLLSGATVIERGRGGV